MGMEFPFFTHVWLKDSFKYVAYNGKVKNKVDTIASRKLIL